MLINSLNVLKLKKLQKMSLEFQSKILEGLFKRFKIIKIVLKKVSRISV